LKGYDTVSYTYMNTDAQFKGLLNNEALFSYLKELGGEPYKADFKRWHQLLYACHYATQGKGLPAFIQWCSMSLDMTEALDDARECWHEVDENDATYSLYNTQHLAIELAKQGSDRLKNRLVLDEPERIKLKLKQLLNNISTRDQVVGCIDAIAEIDYIPPFDLYEMFLSIKERTEVPLNVLEQMYADVIITKKNVLTGALNVTQGGKSKPTLSNFTYFCKTQGIDVVVNHMTHEVNIIYQGKRIERLHLLDLLNEAGFAGFTGKLETMLRTLSRENKGFHPVAQWLDGCEWDGIDRIDELMKKLNVRRCPPKLLYMYLTRWLLGGIEAVYNENGIAKQSMLVLHGKPACGKTSFFESLVPAEFRRDWFTPNVRQPWNSAENKKSIASWLTEVSNIHELLLAGHAVSGRVRTLLDMTAHLDADNDTFYRREKTTRRMFYGAGITTLKDRIPFSVDRHYFVIPIYDIKFNLEIDVQQLWLQIKQLYDDGQRHILLRSEIKQHYDYAKILSTHPYWIIKRKRHA
jgi:Virulence-associated protein E-like domain